MQTFQPEHQRTPIATGDDNATGDRIPVEDPIAEIPAGGDIAAPDGQVIPAQGAIHVRDAIPAGAEDRGPGEEEDESDEDDDEDEDISFNSLFYSFSKQWLNAQLNHNVSLAASNSFWNLAFKYVSKLHELKETENIKRKIPQFMQIRKNLFQDLSPNVIMNFAFLNKNDNSIHHVNTDHTPVKEFERNPQYQKLYEEAHIKVTLPDKLFQNLDIKSVIISKLGKLIAFNFDEKCLANQNANRDHCHQSTINLPSIIK